MLADQILHTFRQLLEEATASGETEPTAMNLASLDAETGQISSRMVLLKGVDAQGFRFFTNYDSDKAKQLRSHAQVALCFHWKSLRQGVQVRVEGVTARLLAEESDAYFASRPRGSQVGAWASLQSQVLPDRANFETRLSSYTDEFKDQDIPRPPYWGGFLVVPDRVEFWYAAPFRCHDRVCWRRHGDSWTQQLLYP